MKRRDRLRRVVMLSCSFGRNLAYYSAGREPAFSELFNEKHPGASFWRQANSSFLDIAVLEWRKLIADKKDQHCWYNIPTDRTKFEKDLLDRLEMTSGQFDEYVKTFRA